MGGKPSKASIESKPTTPSESTTSTNQSTPQNTNNSTPKVAQTNKPTASQPRISQNDITLIKSTHQSLEALCKMTQPVHVIQEHFDTLFAKVDPRGYKSLVSSQQGARYNLLHPVLRLVVSPGPNTKGSEEDLYNLIKANEYLCPSCSPQLPLFQSLLLYLKRAHSLHWNHEGIKLLLSRIETINIDVLYSVYCTFDDFIQHTVGINTQEQFEITKTLLNFLREQAPKLPIQPDMIPPPYQPYSLSVHHITMIGAKLFHRVQVPPMFYLTRSSVDNAIFREAFEFVCDAYGYDLYNPISGRATQPMNSSLPYPHHCLFHAPVVGGSDHQKSLSRPIINLDNEIINPELAQSRCGSTFTYLSSQNKIFSLDLVVYLLHLAAKDQVRAIKKHHQGQFPPGEDEHTLYKKIAVATKDWLYTLSSSYGVPALATLLHNMLSLHEKVHFSTNSQQTVSKAEFQYEPLSEGAVKFIISMCHTYGDKTLFYDAQNRKATQDKSNSVEKFEVLPREQQDEIFYQTVSDIYYYNPFPLMFALRLIPWLYRFTPDYVEDDVFSYIQLFVSQLLPSTFTSPLLLATNSAKNQQSPQTLENTTVTTIQDKHKLSLAKYKSLWPESVDALEAYENFDNSLPFYSETTLKLQQLWTLIEHYNYNDITNVQLLFNPFFMTLTFPHFGIYNPQMSNITSYLLSLGMLSNFYAKPLFLMNQLQPTRQIKYPSLMMEQAAIGGTGLAKCYIWCYNHSSIASQGLSFSGKDSSYKFYPTSTYNNPLSFPMQFPAIFSTPFPTSQLLPPATLSNESYNECSILQQQLAFTRHVLNQMTQNSLNDNITLHLYILNILQVLFFQLHTGTSETQANVIRTQIIVGFNQLKAYIQKSGSLFAQLSAEDKPQQQLHNNYVTSTRSIQSPQARVIEKFAPTPMTHLDFFNSSTRRQEYLKVQLPVLMHTMSLLCSTGLIWTLLLPNLDDLFTAQVLPTRVLDGMTYSNISNIYSMTMLTLFQIFALQAYIIEQQESILPQSKPTNAMSGAASPLIPYPLGENVTPSVPLTPAQELNFTLTTYLCYLPPLPPNVFATSLVGSFFRIADLLIEKLNYIVSASASRKISAQITPLEYFCAIICYQPLVYELSRVQEYFSTTGDIIDTSVPQPTGPTEESTTSTTTTAPAAVKTGQTAGSIAGTGKVSHLFGYTIQFEFDSTAYDPSLPPLPEISNSFLWLLYTSKKVERFAYKKDHLDSNLEQLVQQHYHATLPEEVALIAVHEPVNAPNLPTTPELMFFIDSTITTYNHFSQWSNHYCGWGTPLSTIAQNSTHLPIAPKFQHPLVTHFSTPSAESTSFSSYQSYIINDPPPYQSTGLLSFMLDCCSQTNIDDVMVLLQGISPSEATLEYLRQTSEGIDENELQQFKIYQPFVDQLNRPISMPVRPYTYSKLNLSQRFYSCDFLFNGLKPQYREDIMKGFAQLQPLQPDAIDYLHKNNLIEYQSTVGAEIVINAILRRCSDAVLAAIVNSIGKEDLSHVIRPMYIINPTTGINESFSLRDFAIAAQIKSYAPALYTSLMQ